MQAYVKTHPTNYCMEICFISSGFDCCFKSEILLLGFEILNLNYLNMKALNDETGMKLDFEAFTE